MTDTGDEGACLNTIEKSETLLGNAVQSKSATLGDGVGQAGRGRVIHNLKEIAQTKTLIIEKTPELE